jgi:hypothetical protein
MPSPRTRRTRVSIETASRQTGYSRRWLRRLCESGRVPGALKVGRDWTLTTRSVRQIAELRAHADRLRNDPRVAELLRENEAARASLAARLASTDPLAALHERVKREMSETLANLQRNLESQKGPRS